LLFGLTFEPFEFKYISPYAGIFAGYTYVADYEIKGSDNKSEKLSSIDLLQLGMKLGLEILPKQAVSLFIEARYQYFPASVSRPTRVSQGVLGGPVTVNGEANLSSLSVGGGVRLNY